MEEYKVKQLQPNHADHISNFKSKYIKEMLDNEYVIAQPKYDGERMLIHIDNGNVYCTSRRFSKKTDRYMENQEKLPYLQEAITKFFKTHYELGYTVLDCECYSTDWSTVVGVLHSLPSRAIKLQEDVTVKFAVFDCLFYDGIDMRNVRYMDRLQAAADIVNELKYENMHMCKLMRLSDNYNEYDIVSYDTFISSILCKIEKESQIELAMNSAINKGFEGIVVKSLDRTYYERAASVKCKKFETVDLVVCGYQDGNGKYEGTVGALEIGYYDSEKDKVIKVSKVNCGTDKDRAEWNENRQNYLNTVVEVKCQEITEKSLRHPVLIRKRPDKDYKMCTKDTIFKI